MNVRNGLLAIITATVATSTYSACIIDVDPSTMWFGTESGYGSVIDPAFYPHQIESGMKVGALQYTRTNDHKVAGSGIAIPDSSLIVNSVISEPSRTVAQIVMSTVMLNAPNSNNPSAPLMAVGGVSVQSDINGVSIWKSHFHPYIVERGGYTSWVRNYIGGYGRVDKLPQTITINDNSLCAAITSGGGRVNFKWGQQYTFEILQLSATIGTGVPFNFNFMYSGNIRNVLSISAYPMNIDFGNIIAGSTGSRNLSITLSANSGSRVRYELTYTNTSGTAPTVNFGGASSEVITIPSNQSSYTINRNVSVQSSRAGVIRGNIVIKAQFY